MYFLLKKDEIISISADKELLEATIRDGEKIVSEEDYIKSFTLEDTINQPLKDDSTSDNIPSTSSSDNDEDIEDSDIELNPVFVLEAITDLQTQLEELQEVPHEESSTEEIETLAN
jgi:hypothetical protein|nr:MAG TPA: hypothetical protein [Caudoviricetes sp.]